MPHIYVKAPTWRRIVTRRVRNMLTNAGTTTHCLNAMILIERNARVTEAVLLMPRPILERRVTVTDRSEDVTENPAIQHAHCRRRRNTLNTALSGDQIEVDQSFVQFLEQFRGTGPGQRSGGADSIEENAANVAEASSDACLPTEPANINANVQEDNDTTVLDTTGDGFLPTEQASNADDVEQNFVQFLEQSVHGTQKVSANVEEARETSVLLDTTGNGILPTEQASNADDVEQNFVQYLEQSRRDSIVVTEASVAEVKSDACLPTEPANINANVQALSEAIFGTLSDLEDDNDSEQNFVQFLEQNQRDSGIQGVDTGGIAHLEPSEPMNISESSTEAMEISGNSDGNKSSESMDISDPKDDKVQELAKDQRAAPIIGRRLSIINKNDEQGRTQASDAVMALGASANVQRAAPIIGRRLSINDRNDVQGSPQAFDVVVALGAYEQRAAPLVARRASMPVRPAPFHVRGRRPSDFSLPRWPSMPIIPEE